MSRSQAPQTTLEQSDAFWQLLLRKKIEDGTAAPAVCIQGGGARGAWEAGVLAGLLKAGPNTTPSSIWGTSAGALNALWSADPSVRAEPTKLLCYWVTLAQRLMFATTASAIAVLAALFFLPIELTLALLMLAGVAILLLYILAKRRILKRLPGLIPPVVARLVVPRPKSVAPEWNVYTCVSAVDSASRPEFWGESKRGWFLLHRDSSHCRAEHIPDGQEVNAFHVAVASASIPVVVHPARLAGMTLLDGGLVANLPAGFILSNGSLGGAYVLCIVPRDIEELSDTNPIDHRTIRFLLDLSEEQAKHRSAAAAVTKWSGPAHVHTPVFVLSPNERLQSGLAGFWPRLLRWEFRKGMQDAEAFSAALEAFAGGDASQARKYLLEEVLEQCRPPAQQVTRSAWWYKWANTCW